MCLAQLDLFTTDLFTAILILEHLITSNDKFRVELMRPQKATKVSFGEILLTFSIPSLAVTVLLLDLYVLSAISVKQRFAEWAMLLGLLVVCSLILLWWLAAIGICAFDGLMAARIKAQPVVKPQWVPKFVRNTVFALLGIGSMASPAFAAESPAADLNFNFSAGYSQSQQSTTPFFLSPQVTGEVAQEAIETEPTPVVPFFPAEEEQLQQSDPRTPQTENQVAASSTEAAAEAFFQPGQPPKDHLQAQQEQVLAQFHNRQVDLSHRQVEQLKQKTEEPLTPTPTDFEQEQQTAAEHAGKSQEERAAAERQAGNDQVSQEDLLKLTGPDLDRMLEKLPDQELASDLNQQDSQQKSYTGYSAFFGVQAAELAEKPAEQFSSDQAQTQSTPKVKKTEELEVSSGDTLWSIAQQQIQSDEPADVLEYTQQLYAINAENLESIDSYIYPGQVINIPSR